MPRTGQDIRKSIEANWNEYLSKYGNLFSSDNISGSSPPSVFVGSYGYPKVWVGPMVPPIHGDTTVLDSPEQWVGKSLEEIVNFRLNLVRGIQKVAVSKPEGRYVENLQDVAMSSGPIDSDIEFQKDTIPITSIDGESAPFGPIGEVKKAKYSPTSTVRSIEKVYYDNDLKATDAVLNLYNNGVEISKIQKCFSIGMLGKERKLVPTRWSITATDDIISNSLVSKILDYDMIDSCKMFSYDHLGNIFSVILFPHRWLFEMQEAWHDGNSIGFGSDYEDAKGIDHSPAIAGAYFAAKLGVTEYLDKIRRQAGILILREIQPEYAVPVGVWQIREAIREAMKQKPILTDTLDNAVSLSTKRMSISKSEWFAHGKMLKLLRQKSIEDFF